MSDKKRILLIATGGTIASKKSDNGLKPQITPEELLEYIPQGREICEIEVMQLLNIDSSNMEPVHWKQMVRAIRGHYERFDGFVIAHGTDTMAYTAAALSYMIQNTDKPVVITGAQKPIDLEITDAKSNLIDSFLYAADEESQGVQIVFDGKVIAGTRAKKMRSKSYNAFSSIDYPETAILRGRQVVYYIPEHVTGAPEFYDRLDPGVFVLKLIPGIDAGIFDYLKAHYRALVIESFGVGGLPCYGDESFYHAVRDWVQSGRVIVMTTQVPHEGSDMEVYQVGHRAKRELGLIEAYSMTSEAVVTKLMWILGQTDDYAEICRLFRTPVQKDQIY